MHEARRKKGEGGKNIGTENILFRRLLHLQHPCQRDCTIIIRPHEATEKHIRLNIVLIKGNMVVADIEVRLGTSAPPSRRKRGAPHNLLGDIRVCTLIAQQVRGRFHEFHHAPNIERPTIYQTTYESASQLPRTHAGYQPQIRLREYKRTSSVPEKKRT